MSLLSCSISFVGVQNEPSQDIPQWYELKASLVSDSSRETSALSFNYLEKLESESSFIHNKRLSAITSFDLSTGQGKPLFTKHLFFLCFNGPLNLPRCTTSPSARDVLYNLILLSIFEPLLCVGGL